jgi:hypothetical protein
MLVLCARVVCRRFDERCAVNSRAPAFSCRRTACSKSAAILASARFFYNNNNNNNNNNNARHRLSSIPLLNTVRFDRRSLHKGERRRQFGDLRLQGVGESIRRVVRRPNTAGRIAQRAYRLFCLNNDAGVSLTKAKNRLRAQRTSFFFCVRVMFS